MASDQGGERLAGVDDSQLDPLLVEERQVVDHEALRREAALKRDQEMVCSVFLSNMSTE